MINLLSFSLKVRMRYFNCLSYVIGDKGTFPGLVDVRELFNVCSLNWIDFYAKFEHIKGSP